ncbi:MAG: hypothetical protein HYS78_02185 [Parcubacteria group bacterium]|nr:hypothetical protein [Parcubacteria group bacterium]
MTKETKKLILVPSFMAFFVLSYLIVLYAFGWQFDFKSFKWQETGGLLLKANMEGIRVFINNEPKGKTSFLSNTFVQKNILPGGYNLTFKKDGFPVLNKRIEVRSGEASQLIHLYLAGDDEINDFIANSEPKKENPDYFMGRTDGLLYRRLEDEKLEKVSSESVYIKDFRLKVLQENIYLASSDPAAPGVFLLDSTGQWEEIHSLMTNDLILSPDNKKMAIVGPAQITVLWLKNENEPPYFEKNQKETVLKIEGKIKEALWFKTGWHIIYLTETGETHFLELDPLGGRNDVKI